MVAIEGNKRTLNSLVGGVTGWAAIRKAWDKV